MNDAEHFSKREQLIGLYHKLIDTHLEYGMWGVPDSYQDVVTGIINKVTGILWNEELIPVQQVNQELSGYCEQLLHINRQTRGWRGHTPLIGGN